MVIRIDHEVIAKNLKMFHLRVQVFETCGPNRNAAVLLCRLVELSPCSFCGEEYQSFDLLVKKCFIYERLFVQIGKRKYVSLLELSVVRSMFLNCIVGQMSEKTAGIEGERLTAESDVSFLEKIKFSRLSYQSPHSDVELSLIQ